MRRERTIPWQAFGVKHRQYIARWRRPDGRPVRMMCAEGAIRSGKTIDHCVIAAMYLETCPDKYHLASGSTVANAKLNIGVCNGFGLEALFRGRCKWARYRGSEALLIGTRTGEKAVVFAGGGRADSYRRILGNSYGLWIATEVNEHYDGEDSRTSFLKVAAGRQLAAREPLTLWDLNPGSPDDPIYSRYIDRYRALCADPEADEAFGGFVYGHFTIADNLSVTPARRLEIERQYDSRSVWYRRDILGERCVAEGLCFPRFADDPERWTRTELPAGWSKVVIGVDFGGSGSRTCFCLTGFEDGYRRLTVLMEDALPPGPGIGAEEICARYTDFYRRALRLCGRVDWTLCDSAAPTMINSLASAARAAGLPWRGIAGCRKNPVSQRPRTVDRLLTSGRLRFAPGCPETVRAIAALRWDKKRPDEPEDRNLGNINDRWDAFCYTWLDFVERIDRG